MSTQTNDSIEQKLHEMGLRLPEPMKLPPGMVLPFPWVHVRGKRVFVSGHGPLNPNGLLLEPRGRVGQDITIEQGYEAAKATGLAILSSLKMELGSLDRITAWLRVFGMVNMAPGFNQHPAVIDGFSHLILALYGEERGRHARSAVGMAGLPMDIPVEIEGEVEIDGEPLL